MLIRVPDSWPHWLIAGLAMLVLAALDLGGAFAAKEAVARRSPSLGALGVVLFVLLFWVYASSLRYAELAPVTFGWVVLLQVGVLLLDRFRYQTPMSRGQWVAVAVVLAAQAYLLLAPTPAPAPEIAGGRGAVSAERAEAADAEKADAEKADAEKADAEKADAELAVVVGAELAESSVG